jgi:uncharacterized protein with GYD domain
MPKFLIEVKYTLDGIKGVRTEGGSAREAVARTLVEGLGGKLEAYYFAFGGADCYVIADMPDNVSAAAIGLATSAAGGVTTSTTVLLTPAEMDAAAKKEATYRPPGG